MQYCEISINIGNFIAYYGKQLIWLVRTKEEKRKGRREGMHLRKRWKVREKGRETWEMALQVCFVIQILKDEKPCADVSMWDGRWGNSGLGNSICKGTDGFWGVDGHGTA